MTITTGQDPQVRRLSLAQEQLWFLDQLAPGEATYNVMLVWRLRGPLRVDLLARCLTLLAARHEALRVTIRDQDGTPYQAVAAPTAVPLPVTDLRGLPGAAQREQQVQAAIDAMRAEPYDLAAGPLCRFRLLQLGAEEYVFCQGFHHIITDGWSAAVLNAELSAAYLSLSTGTEPELPGLELGYLEFARAQRERLRGDVLAGELEFWQRRLAGLPVLDLPADRPRPVGGSHRGETLIQDLPQDLRGIVRRLGDSHGASMFMVIAAAFSLVLSRYCGLDDVPVGVPMLGRPDPELEALVGMFINMVVLRCDLSGDPSFSDLIDRVADGSMELYEHQEVSFHQVVDAVQPARDPDRNPLFGVSIQLLGESNSGENLSLPGVAAEFVPLASVHSRFDFALNVIDTGTSLRAVAEYSCDLFDRWRMEAMLGHLTTVLRTAAADPGRRLSAIPIVAGAEAERLLSAGHGDAARGIRPPRHLDAGGQAYVVDPSLHLVPRGVPGELVISNPGESGPGSGELIADPFRPGYLAQRTGDRVRWSRDLQLEYLDPADGRAGGPDTPAGAPGGAPASGRAEPRTPTEDSVAAIVGAVLSLASVNTRDSFFSIGGNSLHAMRVVSRVNKGFGIKLTVRELYGNVTVQAISALVDEKVDEKVDGRPAGR